MTAWHRYMSHEAAAPCYGRYLDNEYVIQRAAGELARKCKV